MKENLSDMQCSPMCDKNICSCKGATCNYLYKKYGMKKWVFRIILVTIALGLFVPFFAEVICTICAPQVIIGLNTWNQFVSIILGIVATVLSIVSMIMGFKNYDDTLGIQEKYTVTLNNIEKIAQDLEKVKDNVGKMMALDEQIQDLNNTINWGQDAVEI